jgi:F-type H+-transporting ATPase subunit b
MNQTVILAAAEGANPLIPNVWEILVTLLGFAVLMFIVVKFVVPAFEKTFAERTEAIEGGIAKAEAAQAEASAALDEYKQQLLDARTEANRIREDARAEGAQILAELKDKAQAEANRISEQAQAQIAAERQAAVTSLRSEVGTLATELAGKIVGESLNDDARAARVVDRFLADLETQSAGAAQ